MKVKNEITIYEVNGKEISGLDRPVVSIENHWSRSSFVVIVVNGTSVTVPASDLRKAIQNATNT